MNTIISWLRNNLITIVEVVSVVYDAVEVVINGLARLIPGNKTITTVHSFLAKIQEPLKKIKSFLLQRVG